MKKLKNNFERKIHNQLKRAKVVFKYEPERIPYVIAGHYIPDFIINTPTGTLYIETKGYLRPEAKRKLIAVKKQHPELDIRIVFYEQRKSNSRWAERCGFKWAVSTIPQEWIEGF